MKPHPNNFCGGNYKDWLEVMLLSECNGKCSWCIEKNGYRPKKKVDRYAMLTAMLSSEKQNIILLGGEPTLHPDLVFFINSMRKAGRNVYLTTNGSKLTYFTAGLYNRLTGINVSIHNYGLKKNQEITGINLNDGILSLAIQKLKLSKVKVRFNCNCIKGHIDNKFSIRSYARWAKMMGADSVRFAELKLDTGAFVDLAKVLDYKYNLNDDPFTHGCSTSGVIEGMEVNFRQMCGIQTECRPMPTNPEQDAEKSVLYYDGKIYDGWQTKKEIPMKDSEIKKLIQDIKSGKVSEDEAIKKIKKNEKVVADKAKIEGRVEGNISGSGGCRY